MIRKGDILDSARIAAPCHALWDSMEGDERVRHCCDCRLNVYNIAEMDRDEAIRLIHQAEGRLCLRLHRRRDGTVITRDCPRGVWALRRKAALAVAYSVGLFASVAAFAVGVRREDGSSPWSEVRIHDAAWRNKLPALFQKLLDKIDPLPVALTGKAPVPMGNVMVGAMAAPVRPPSAAVSVGKHVP